MARASSSSFRANSDAQGIVVSGEFVGGGSALTSQRSDRLTWTAKHVVRSAGTLGWSAGIVAGGVVHSERLKANANGVLQFESTDALAAALRGAPTATWLISRGDGAVAYRGATVSPFVQRVLARTNRIHVEAGVRADYQSGVGIVVSPRLWSAAEWNGIVIQAGSGIFTHPIPDAVFIRDLRDDGDRMREFVAAGVALDELADAVAEPRPVHTALAPQIGASREVMHRVALERRFGRFTPSLEYTRTQESRRLGADRLASGAEWVDVIASDRSAARHRIRARTLFRWGNQMLTGTYEWLHAADNGEGPFHYQRHDGDRASEWARSAGLPPHVVTAVAWLRLPLQVYASVTDTWQSTAPYDVTSPRDSDGDGLFNERNGWRRNSGRLPVQHLMSVRLSKRIPLAPLLGMGTTLPPVTIGWQLDNVLNVHNYIGIGSVVDSSLFGRPLRATAGRSARFSVTIG